MENTINNSELTNLAELLKTLAHPVRLCIVKGLADGGGCVVGHMQQCLNLPQSTISQHLAKLRLSKIVSASHQGTSVTYCLSDSPQGQLAYQLISSNLLKNKEL